MTVHDNVIWELLLKFLIMILKVWIVSLSSRKNLRAAIIRKAIRIYLESKVVGSDKAAFGIWKEKKVDSIDYQEDIRSEWGWAMNAVFDTNILIDYLNGEKAAFKELSRYQHKFIGVMLPKAGSLAPYNHPAGPLQPGLNESLPVHARLFPNAPSEA